jgi:translation initiation factor 2 alpha subunit (eIF-2alpha)
MGVGKYVVIQSFAERDRTSEVYVQVAKQVMQAYLALLQQVIVSVCKVSPHRSLYLCSLNTIERHSARKKRRFYAFQRS